MIRCINHFTMRQLDTPSRTRQVEIVCILDKNSFIVISEYVQSALHKVDTKTIKCIEKRKKGVCLFISPGG